MTKINNTAKKGTAESVSKGLTNGEMNDIYRFSIDPVNSLKDKGLVDRLNKVGSKIVTVDDLVSFTNRLVNYNEEGDARRLGILEHVVQKELKLSKEDIYKYAKAYDDQIKKQVENYKKSVAKPASKKGKSTSKSVKKPAKVVKKSADK